MVSTSQTDLLVLTEGVSVGNTRESFCTGNHLAESQRTIIRKVRSSQGYVNNSLERFLERFPTVEFPYERQKQLCLRCKVLIDI